MQLPQEIIRRKRDGETLDRETLTAFIEGLTRGDISDAQAAAFAMAIFFRGLSPGECAGLTLAMARSGLVLDWHAAGLEGPIVDKHSTGGVGDNVSLILAPAVAACGLTVPIIAGRGLGHTGGTIDKLEAIPGYQTRPDLKHFKETVRRCGCAIIGQMADLAPADKKLYAIRDVTGTVESASLITASILAKKIAAGLDALVMDVKAGSGAFLPALKEARSLARTIISVAAEAGLPVRALITDMDQPLASSAGNGLEVAHAIAHLTGGKIEARLHEVVLELGAEMLLAGGVAGADEAKARVETVLSSGAAAERFARMVAALGGPHNLLEKPEKHISRAPVIKPVYAREAGFVTDISTRALGLCVVGLGGGRRGVDDAIDPSVGLSHCVGIGGEVAPDIPLCLVHARSADDAARAAKAIFAAHVISEKAPRTIASCIIERIS